MAESQDELRGPDLRNDGLPLSELATGAMAAGHFDGEAVILARIGDEVFGVGESCTHYGGSLADGLFDGEQLRCPWHHACFDARSGRATRAPALNPLQRYAVAEREGRLYVTGTLDGPVAAPAAAPVLGSVVIVGAGAAGNAAAETLRAEGYGGRVVLVGSESAVPYDRPNLSKDFLAGTAPEEWIPLRDEDFYREREIELRLGVEVTAIDTAARSLTLGDGSQIEYGALLLATGAEPVTLDLGGPGGPPVHYLRSLADSRAIIGAAGGASAAVVIGASFIGTEVAASLRQREIEVHVVEPEPLPLGRVLGPQLGGFVRALHEEHGVVFHLGRTVSSIEAGGVMLDDGTALAADLVVVGVGVRPRTALAEAAGIEVDRGVLVDEHLRTSAAGVWAAGDIARWPDAYSGQRIRVEHWVVAERQGQAAARDILGRGEPFRDVPFFWSQHYDVPINYVGHAEDWDEIVVEGSIEDRDCVVAYRRNGRVLAVASIYRDLESLRAELAMERGELRDLAAVTRS